MSAVVAVGMISTSYGAMPLMGHDGGSRHFGTAQEADCGQTGPLITTAKVKSGQDRLLQVTGCHTVTSIQPVL